MLIYNFRSVWLCVGLGAVVLALNFISPEIINTVGEFFVIPEEFANPYTFDQLWEGVKSIVQDNFFSGIGVGETAFRTAFLNFATIDTNIAANSGNLFLQVLVELGIVGLVLFAFALIAFAQKCFVSTKAKNRRSRSRTMICAGFASIFGGCVMGWKTYIWSNDRTFLIFFIVFALTVALTKVNERERESERVINNMSSVDIEID
jgi:O-antigen ligase